MNGDAGSASPASWAFRSGSAAGASLDLGMGFGMGSGPRPSPLGGDGDAGMDRADFSIGSDGPGHSLGHDASGITAHDDEVSDSDGSSTTEPLTAPRPARPTPAPPGLNLGLRLTDVAGPGAPNFELDSTSPRPPLSLSMHAGSGNSSLCVSDAGGQGPAPAPNAGSGIGPGPGTRSGRQSPAPAGLVLGELSPGPVGDAFDRGFDGMDGGFDGISFDRASMSTAEFHNGGTRSLATRRRDVFACAGRWVGRFFVTPRHRNGAIGPSMMQWNE